MSEIKVTAEAVNYNYGEVITPYQLAGQCFDQPIGAWRAKAAVWRVATLISLFASGILLALFILQVYQPQHSIVTVQISPKGFVRSAAVLTDEYTIPSEISGQFIKNYVAAFFSEQGLENLQQKNKDFVYSFSSESVSKDYLKLLNNKIYQGVSEPLKVTEINWVSSDTYQAKWSRAIKDASTGEVIEYENYLGQFIVRFVTPDQESLILQNPLGFYVEQASWIKASSPNTSEAKAKNGH